MNKLKFELTQEQAQHIIIVLAKQPFEEVVDIITTMQQQANAQIKEEE